MKMSRQRLRVWLSFTTFGLNYTFLASGAHAADRDAWKHPDPRFAAIDSAADDDDYTGAQRLLAELRAEAKRTKDQTLLADALIRAKS
jgi:hypothetical protein